VVQDFKIILHHRLYRDIRARGTAHCQHREDVTLETIYLNNIVGGTKMLQNSAIDSINSLLSKLPESLQIEALHYVEYLISRRDGEASQSGNQSAVSTPEPSSLTKTRNGFGILKGKVTIADDFDAPLDEFTDYQ
jgi:hypothetical protein